MVRQSRTKIAQHSLPKHSGHAYSCEVLAPYVQSSTPDSQAGAAPAPAGQGQPTPPLTSRSPHQHLHHFVKPVSGPLCATYALRPACTTASPPCASQRGYQTTFAWLQQALARLLCFCCTSSGFAPLVQAHHRRRFHGQAESNKRSVDLGKSAERCECSYRGRSQGSRSSVAQCGVRLWNSPAVSLCERGTTGTGRAAPLGRPVQLQYRWRTQPPAR
jgi:hypothetical protein